MTRLFIGNLPPSATDSSVSAFFATQGKVESVTLIVDPDTGRLRGFGFVEMPAPDAVRAIQTFHGQEFEGRALKVRQAEEPQTQGDRKRRRPSRH